MFQFQIFQNTYRVALSKIYQLECIYTQTIVDKQVHKIASLISFRKLMATQMLPVLLFPVGSKRGYYIMIDNGIF